MKELRTVVSDAEFEALAHVAQVLGVPVEEILKRSPSAYLDRIKAEPAFEPVGFGMWANRPEMQDAAWRSSSCAPWYCSAVVIISVSPRVLCGGCQVHEFG